MFLYDFREFRIVESSHDFGKNLFWYPHILLICFHPTFRIGGPMEYLRDPRVERSAEMGRKAIVYTKNKSETNVSMTTVYMVIPQT